MGGNDLLLDDSLFLKDDNGEDGLIFGGTEEEYKVIKLESNLSNLNKDILKCQRRN